MRPLSVDIAMWPRHTLPVELPSCWDHEVSERHTRYYGRDRRILADLGRYIALHCGRMGFRRGTVSLGDGRVDLKGLGLVYAVARCRKLGLADCVDGSTQGDV